MVDLEHLKSFILHENALVRRQIVKYFKDGLIRDGAIIFLIFQACERYSSRSNTLPLAYANRQPVDGNSLDIILEWLEKEKNEDVRFHLGRLLYHGLPSKLFHQNQEIILRTRHVERNLRRFHDQREEFSHMTGEELWKNFQDYTKWADDNAKYANDIDQNHLDILIEALAQHDIPDEETICRMLEQDDLEESWLEIFLIDLAGARKIRSAVPLLVDRYRVDTDYMLERCTQALVRIGDPEAARRIGRCFIHEDWSYQNFSSGLLESLKHPVCEEVILSLREEEKLEY